MLLQAGVSCKWINDSQHFLLEHFDTIQNSPSHIYHSALPFSPSSSWLQEYYSAGLSLTVKVVKGLPTEWGECSCTVLLGSQPGALSYWNNTIAVGCFSGDIIILNAITGSQTVVFSGHTDWVGSLAFSSDGRLLVSGSDDRTVKLWDVQTGGVIKTSGHTSWICSVSISVDCTTVASGDSSGAIYLWNIQTMECHQMIRQQQDVFYIRFSPVHPQQLVSISNDKVWWWDVSGHQIAPPCNGSYIAFSSDGTLCALCNEDIVIVQNLDSRAVVAEFYAANDHIRCCCFSPDCRFVAVAAGSTAYIWDITNSDPNLVETFIGHTKDITSLVFSSPSSLISSSEDQLVKFWQISASSQDPVVTNPVSTPFNSVEIKSTTLQAKDGITITSNSDGVIRVWDISTSLCKASYQTPVGASQKRDVHMVNGRLIIAWCIGEIIYVYDVEKWELLEILSVHVNYLQDLKISEDGSKIFCLSSSIQVLSIQTGEVVGSVRLGLGRGICTIDGLRVWISFPEAEPQGWDFGIPGSPPVQVSNIPPGKLHPNGTLLWDFSLFRIRDMVTGKVVLWLPKRFGNYTDVQWNGQYLVASYRSGEVLVLDFSQCPFSRNL